MMEFVFKYLQVLIFVPCIRLAELDVRRKIIQWLSMYRSAHLGYPSCLSDNPLAIQMADAAQVQDTWRGAWMLLKEKLYRVPSYCLVCKVQSTIGTTNLIINTAVGHKLRVQTEGLCIMQPK